MKDNKPDKIKDFLKYLAHKIIAKYRPFVIGVTGSVGKTSTRHAIAAALSTKFHLREPIRNYNNELGIMFTIFGTEGLEEGNKILGWLRVISKALSVWLLPQNYPKVLVLEYGIDHPGDMDTLIDIVRPNIAVLTTIGISHREFFNSEKEIAVEKGKLAAALPADGVYVYNLDDAHVAAQTGRTSARLFSYGKAGFASEKADVVLQSVEEQLHIPPATNLSIQTPSGTVNISIPVIGTAHESAVLAAVAVAEAMEVDPDQYTKGLSTYRAVPGRLNLIAGIKKTILIDDSYNAAPLSTIEALQLLSRFDNPTKIAVLGDMLELGDSADEAHKEIGKLVAELNLSQLVTVGSLGKIIAESAAGAGMQPDKIVSYDTSDVAASAVLGSLHPESAILIKGSQGARMEKITKELMAEPTAATQLLVRQYGKWVE